MKFEEMNLPMIRMIARFYEKHTDCSVFESFQLAVQSYQLQALQDQTFAIDRLTDAIKQGLGVTSTNSTPKFIEAVAMAIGYYQDSPSLVEMLVAIKEEFEELNKKFPPINPPLSEKELEAYKERDNW